MWLGLDAEAWGLVGASIGTAIGAAVLAFKGYARQKEANDQSPVTTDALDRRMLGVEGEARQIQQEIRIAKRELERLIEGENRETRDAVAALRDVVIEIRAIVRARGD